MQHGHVQLDPNEHPEDGALHGVRGGGGRVYGTVQCICVRVRCLRTLPDKVPSMVSKEDKAECSAARSFCTFFAACIASYISSWHLPAAAEVLQAYMGSCFDSGHAIYEQRAMYAVILMYGNVHVARK